MRLVQPVAPRIPPSDEARSMLHDLIGVMDSSEVQPASHISMPAQAIMAALSVQSSIGGQQIWMWAKPLTSRKERITWRR